MVNLGLSQLIRLAKDGKENHLWAIDRIVPHRGRGFQRHGEKETGEGI
jgi:hypothetical protein